LRSVAVARAEQDAGECGGNTELASERQAATSRRDQLLEAQCCGRVHRQRNKETWRGFGSKSEGCSSDGRLERGAATVTSKILSVPLRT
jgi:hypothetical protein